MSKVKSGTKASAQRRRGARSKAEPGNHGIHGTKNRTNLTNVTYLIAIVRRTGQTR